ncbi:hypothetical protein SBA1_680053 [Candidatus Sulfotelmatobacter kueseliae]|uniref:Uncharacterized protein n=1 Tax=Candidatus Sulfotelmatobacter kueseliae TaxID=2042962 RepID=A0A2U3L4W4_9BACT|nr:hypothetical protein SBA1_680053 [Candidatus Sulfotelmatobacter kueseliae]
MPAAPSLPPRSLRRQGGDFDVQGQSPRGAPSLSLRSLQRQGGDFDFLTPDPYRWVPRPCLCVLCRDRAGTLTF